MRWTAVVRESWAATVHQPVSTLLVALVAAAMCLTTLLTVGRTVASERQVLERLESAGSRVLTVEDVSGHEVLTPAAVAVIGTLSSVERAFGVVAPVDVRSTQTAGNGHALPAWGIVGDVRHAADLIAGRWPDPGEALVTAAAATALGLDGPVGAVSGASIEAPVVGVYEPRAPFDAFAGVLYVPRRPIAATSVRILTTSAAEARLTQDATLAVIDAAPDALTITSPAALAEVQRQIGADLSASARSIVLLVLAGGVALVTIVVSADVLVRRTDMGRRRALGATRGALVALVMLRTFFSAVVGALVATTAGSLWTRSSSGQDMPLQFMAATVVLAVVAAAVAAFLPAAVAAFRDPLKVLRTP